MSVRELVNPLSTRATEWWCHSALRGLLTDRRLHPMPRALPIDSGDSWTGFVPAPGPRPVTHSVGGEPLPGVPGGGQ